MFRVRSDGFGKPGRDIGIGWPIIVFQSCADALNKLAIHAGFGCGLATLSIDAPWGLGVGGCLGKHPS